MYFWVSFWICPFGPLIYIPMNWSEVKSLSRIWLFATPWTIACKTPLSMEFSRQEYWSGLPFPFPGDLPDPGIEPRSPALQADALLSEPPGKPLYTYTKANKHGFDYCSLMEKLEISQHKTSKFILFQNCFSCFRSFALPYEFWISLSIPTEEACWDFYWEYIDTTD